MAFYQSVLDEKIILPCDILTKEFSTKSRRPDKNCSKCCLHTAVIIFGSFADSIWVYAIMNCPLCVVIGVIIGVIIIVICGRSSCPQVWSQKLYILHTYAHMPLVYAHEFVSEYKLYFLNGSHFSSFLYVVLLTTWLSLEPSYLAQLWTCTGALHSQRIMQLWTIFLKK